MLLSLRTRLSLGLEAEEYYEDHSHTNDRPRHLLYYISGIFGGVWEVKRECYDSNLRLSWIKNQEFSVIKKQIPIHFNCNYRDELCTDLLINESIKLMPWLPEYNGI
ncbi:hypothetical protein D8B26_004192 [Coccidioides posadasii str. Silveira]|uniref:uncharacterized protein n=1 Tax=Coccidioides posadasii (strain RMSCC 757 / Silveira) TaxID=443226 RepID=UPI001BEF5B2C|nr:hypothetical protein D8B26_004192 [Coccidioides posadasii str. Silveira]